MTVHVTIELTEEQKARFEIEAKRLQTTVSALLVESTELRLGDEADPWVAAVQEGIEDIDAGRTFSHEEVGEAIAARLRERGLISGS